MIDAIVPDGDTDEIPHEVGRPPKRVQKSGIAAWRSWMVKEVYFFTEMGFTA